MHAQGPLFFSIYTLFIAFILSVYSVFKQQYADSSQKRLALMLTNLLKSPALNSVRMLLDLNYLLVT